MPERTGTLLIQFARLPRPGEVKTRLQPPLSAREACEVHEALLSFTVRQLLASGLGPVELWVSEPGEHRVLDEALSLGVAALHVQQGGTLGARMYHALVHGLARYSRVLLVGSDCPGLDGAYLAGAREALNAHDCVVGPAIDGGYVLIGARRISASCFDGVAWGSGEVFAQTVARLEAAGLSWSALPPRRDIDRPDDLPLWDDIQRGNAGQALRR